MPDRHAWRLQSEYWPGVAPLGRFGTAGMSKVIGPAMLNLNAGLSKYFAVSERVGIKVYIGNADPGVTTKARTSGFGGNRTGQVGARIEF